MRFRDRAAAGRQLAAALEGAGLERPLVLALPRGGVPVGTEVAQALGAPLEVFVARKLGAPGQPELGIGAIAEGLAEPVLNSLADALGLTGARLAPLVDQERQELERRVRRYRAGRDLPEIEGRDVVVVDDGLATGVTAEAALRALRGRRPSRLVLAVPVCAPETAARLGGVADDVVCVTSPTDFAAVGVWYEDFAQTTDEEVLELLDRARAVRGRAGGGDRARRDVVERTVRIPQAHRTVVHGDLAGPEGARGLVVFAHGSGSSRHSTRNRHVAASLQRRGLATLLMDLLTVEEEAEDRHTAHLRFDIDLLADRLLGAVSWLDGVPEASDLPLGAFGASTGAAAALVAAAREPERFDAVVSRGGRPDLAGADLPRVEAPTLLVVGGEDLEVLELNRRAAGAVTAPCRVEVVPGATHLFEEPGTLDAAARLAGDWFCQHLGATAATAPERS